MNDFTPIFKALSDATQELIATNQALIASNQHLTAISRALTDATTATQHARDEGEDVKVTVQRLETLVQELVRRQNDAT